jgi:hypothetical protein
MSGKNLVNFSSFMTITHKLIKQTSNAFETDKYTRAIAKPCLHYYIVAAVACMQEQVK